MIELLLYSQKQNVSLGDTSIDDSYRSDLVFLKKTHLVFKIIFVGRIIITMGNHWAISVYQVIY